MLRSYRRAISSSSRLAMSRSISAVCSPKRGVDRRIEAGVSENFHGETQGWVLSDPRRVFDVNKKTALAIVRIVQDIGHAHHGRRPALQRSEERS